MSKRRLGLIVNPLAGIGGPLGFKGSDDVETLKRAKELGGKPGVARRVISALQELKEIKDDLEIISFPLEMGGDILSLAGFQATLIGSIQREMTTSSDTKKAASMMLHYGIKLLLFAGGDGTARDIYDVVHFQVPVLGIPAGVKIHSSVFATTPKEAGRLASLFFQGKVLDLKEVEVMDIDEEALKRDHIRTSLYGYLKVPYEERRVQEVKTRSQATEKESIEAISQYVVDTMARDTLYLMGPGSTIKGVMDRLGLKNTLLGIDIIMNRRVLASDVHEKGILQLIKDKRVRLILTIIGGQGFLLGRGNQQLTPFILKRIQKENTLVLSTLEKILALEGRPLLLDTGDDEVNQLFQGYYKIVIGYGRFLVYQAQ